MDNADPSPPKRPRTIDFLASQLSKPVRYFPFNRKTMNVIHQGTKSGKIQKLKSQHVMSGSVPLIPVSSTMKFVPNKEANISKKLQKLKLKSPDGRDLGEINVQLLPQKGDGIGGKTIMLQKHSLFGKIDNPASVSILKPLEKSKQLTINGPVSIIQGAGGTATIVNNGYNYVTINTINPVRETGTTTLISNVKPKLETQHSPRILRHPETSKYSSATSQSKLFYMNIDKQSGLNTVKSINNDTRNLVSNQKIIVVHAENYPDLTEGKKNSVSNTPTELFKSSPSKDNTSTEHTPLPTKPRSISSVFWNPSEFPELKSKLSNKKNKGNGDEICRSGGNTINDKSMIIVTQSLGSEQVKTVNTGSIPASTLQRKIKSKSNSWTIVKTSGNNLENRRKRSSENKESSKNIGQMSKISPARIITLNNLNTENTQNVTSTTNNLNSLDSLQCDENFVVSTQDENVEDKSSNNDQRLRENIMVIVHGDVATSKNHEKNKIGENESNNKTISMLVDSSPENDPIATLDERGIDVNVELSNQGSQNPAQPDKSRTQDNVSSLLGAISPQQQQLDIIGRALSSCPDQDLRNKALKALADCGIGVERDIPAPPKVTVCDSRTQTQIFSLLEPNSLLECDENSVVLNKLNLINKIEKPVWQPAQPQPLLPSNELQWPNVVNFPCAEGIPDLDGLLILDEFLQDNPSKEVNEVREILRRPDPLVSQTLIQMQKDLNAARVPDAEGMMGIHRAVLSGNIKEVQRQLIVLKAIKESIEVPNGDGKTSLELAVLHDVDSCIVRVLLMAGAKPAIPTKLHESALIIACKNSSPILPELIKYVTPSSLLDNKDSDGFAPLHYCAQLGNIEGVKSLVAAGAQVNLRDDKSGRTALFLALESKSIEMAWCLLDSGASPSIMNFTGQSPAALVDECRHTSLVEKMNESVR